MTFATAIATDFAAVPATQHKSQGQDDGDREERCVTVIATPEGYSTGPTRRA